MKRFITIAAIGVFFLLILALILLKLFLPNKDTSAENNSQNSGNPFAGLQSTAVEINPNDPSSTVTSCYIWYLREYLSSAEPDAVINEPKAELCFTPSFINSWSSTIVQEEVNPLLRTMDIDESWIDTVHVQTIGQSIRANDQEVTLGSGEGELRLITHLIQQEDATWKIDSVSTANQ